MARLGAQVNATDSEGRTPLHYLESATTGVRALVNLGANINARDMDGRTPLHCASMVSSRRRQDKYDYDYESNEPSFEYDHESDEPSFEYDHEQDSEDEFSDLTTFYEQQDNKKASNNQSLIELLVDLGANIHATSLEGKTALHYAAEERVDDSVKLLVKLGANVNARTYGDYKKASDFARRKIAGFLRRCERIATIEQNSKNNVFPAIEAALTNWELMQHLPHMVKLNLACTCKRLFRLVYPLFEPRKINSSGDAVFNMDYYPLHYFAFKGNTTWLRLAVEIAQVDVNAYNPESVFTPLNVAAHSGSFESVRELIRLGADTKKEHFSSFQLAVQSGSCSSVREFLSIGARIEEKDLHYAAELNVEMLNLLLDSAPYLSVHCVVDEKTLLHRAASGHNVEAIQQLVRMGVDVNAATESGVTPLHEAVNKRKGPLQNRTIQELANAGADLGAWVDAEGTPLCRAVLLQNKEAVRELIRLGGLNFKRIPENSSSASIAAVFRDEEALRKSKPEQSKFGPLAWAIHLGDIHTIRVLVELGEQINDGLFCKAVKLGNTDVVRELAKLHQDMVALMQSAGALHEAAKQGDIAMVHLLLELNADINLKVRRRTPLSLAAQHNKGDMVRELVRLGATPKLGPDLHTFTPQMVELLVTLGAPITVESKSGFYPLESAVVRAKDAAVVRTLVRLGADFRPSTLPFLLHSAVSNGRLDVVHDLLDAGADVNSEHDGCTPLHAACMCENIALVSELIRLGANIRATTQDGSTPFHVAADSSLVACDILKILHDADRTVVQQRTIDGRSALHFAKTAGAVRYLVDLGLDANARTNDELTPLHCVANSGGSNGDVYSMVRELVELGADVNARTHEGKTPLHYAAKWCGAVGRSVVAELLLLGADVRAVDNAGRTPLHYATMRRSKKVMEVLVSCGAQ